jgi:hypothetical protein
MTEVPRLGKPICWEATINEGVRRVSQARPGRVLMSRLNVRFAPKRTKILQCREMTRWGNSRSSLLRLMESFARAIGMNHLCASIQSGRNIYGARCSSRFAATFGA